MIDPASACTELDCALYAISVAAPLVATPEVNTTEPGVPNAVPSTLGVVPIEAGSSPVKVSVLDPA